MHTSASKTSPTSSPLSVMKSALPADCPRWKLLLLDDHADTQEMIRMILEPYADIIEVVAPCFDGTTALEDVEAHHPDMVLVRLESASLDEIETTRAIKRSFPNTVILGLSTQYSPHAYNAMIAAGAVAFVSKEDAPTLLFKTVVHAMSLYRPPLGTHTLPPVLSMAGFARMA